MSRREKLYDERSARTKDFAYATIIIEQVSDTEVRVRKARVIPWSLPSALSPA
jgi:hypothetical protein